MKFPDERRESILLTSPAKINLFLEVAGKRDDGYHDLLNVMQRVTLFDTIILEKGNGNGIVCHASIPDVPPEKNIAFLAAKKFFQKAQIEPSLTIRIFKKIPLGGGLGGGSSNAAAVLKGLNILYNRPFFPNEIYDMAFSLGADVPFFLKSGTWIMKGRGDVFFRRISCRSFYYLLFNFGKKSDTKTVFSRFSSSPRKIGALSRLIKGLQHGKASQVRKEIENDLLKPFLEAYPEQEQIYIDLQKKMCNNLFLSGSGATFFSIFESKTKMRRAFMRLEDSIRKCVIKAKSF